jgi:hypothetical protein
LGGCSGPSPPGTGAREAVQAFCNALISREWETAYASLHASAHSRCTAQQFAGRAERYRRAIGFEPQLVTIRSCEEHESRAIAHVVFKSPAGSARRYYKDAIVLQRSPNGWGVSLPRKFGQ